MEIKRSGFQPSVKGPAEYFTGAVRMDARFSGGGKLSGVTVTFERGRAPPGIRIRWARPCW